jgi:hypothetical protein
MINALTNIGNALFFIAIALFVHGCFTMVGHKIGG